MVMASKSHTCLQSARPRQPHTQSLPAPATSAAARQLPALSGRRRRELAQAEFGHLLKRHFRTDTGAESTSQVPALSSSEENPISPPVTRWVRLPDTITQNPDNVTSIMLEEVVPGDKFLRRGVKRFLERVFRLVLDSKDKLVENTNNQETLKVYHKTVKGVTEDVEGLRFNTAISKMMVLNNTLLKEKEVARFLVEGLLKLLN